jgi:hypothetical protein
MGRKRKISYPSSRGSKGRAAASGPAQSTPPTVAKINLNAGLGRKDIIVGSRVTILGGGLYAGETAVVERLVGGGIPAAFVRTEAGGTRRVRTIDLEPVAARKVDRATSSEPADGEASS